MTADRPSIKAAEFLKLLSYSSLPYGVQPAVSNTEVMACLAFVGDEHICCLSTFRACLCHACSAIMSEDTFSFHACVSDEMGMRRSDIADWCLLRLEADCGVVRVACVVAVSGPVQGRQHIVGAIQWRRLSDRPVVMKLRIQKELVSLNT
jgi:hypothetical protein